MKAVMVPLEIALRSCATRDGSGNEAAIGSWLERRKLRLNEKKTRIVDFARESFEFLGFRLKSRKARSGKSYPHCEPSAKSCNKLREAIRERTGRDTLWKSSGESLQPSINGCGDRSATFNMPTARGSRTKCSGTSAGNCAAGCGRNTPGPKPSTGRPIATKASTIITASYASPWQSNGKPYEANQETA